MRRYCVKGTQNAASGRRIHMKAFGTRRLFGGVVAVIAVIATMVGVAPLEAADNTATREAGVSKAVRANLHMNIAQHYREEANRLAADAQGFEALGDAYRQLALVHAPWR